jgi:hypothetical protein
MPNKILQLKGEKCHGGNKSKKRLTVLAASTMDGSENNKLLVIGPSSFSSSESLFSCISALPDVSDMLNPAFSKHRLMQIGVTLRHEI